MGWCMSRSTSARPERSSKTRRICPESGPLRPIAQRGDQGLRRAQDLGRLGQLDLLDLADRQPDLLPQPLRKRLRGALGAPLEDHPEQPALQLAQHRGEPTTEEGGPEYEEFNQRNTNEFNHGIHGIHGKRNIDTWERKSADDALILEKRMMTEVREESKTVAGTFQVGTGPVLVAKARHGLDLDDDLVEAENRADRTA